MAGQLHEDRFGDGIVVIRFDGSAMGYLDSAMVVTLEAMLARLSTDASARVVILTGARPDVFIRHFDLAELAQASQALGDGAADALALWDSSPFHRITRCIETMPQLVIAAINGHCMGVGFELALACDLRIASGGDYSIGLPEMHIAMCPGGGGTVRLARLLGPARAIELICTAATVSPHKAAVLGMVNQVAPDALAAARLIAAKVVSLSAGGVAAAKRIIHASVDLDIEPALTLEQRAVNARLGSNEVGTLLRQYVDTGADLRQPILKGTST